MTRILYSANRNARAPSLMLSAISRIRSRTGICLGNHGGLPRGKHQRKDCTYKGNPNDVFHFFHSLKNSTVFQSTWKLLLYHSTNRAVSFQVNLPKPLCNLYKFYVLAKRNVECFRIFVLFFRHFRLRIPFSLHNFAHSCRKLT